MRSQQRVRPKLARLTAALAVVAVCGLQPAAGQVLQQAKGVVIHEIVGNQTVDVGSIETYRAKTNVTRDVEFRWTANGGTSLGNPVVYRFQEPGTVEIVVTARNTVSTDRDTIVVTVVGPQPPRAVAEANSQADGNEPDSGEAASSDAGGADVKATSGQTTVAAGDGFRGKGRVDQSGEGYTWVIATYFQRSSAVALANSYLASGYRAGVVADNSGQGTEVYRVILGHFQTEKSAMEARRHLVRAGHKSVILRELGHTG